MTTHNSIVLAGAMVARWADRASRYMAVATGFLITLGTSFTASAFAVTGLCWLFSGNWKRKYSVIRNNPVVLVTLALFALYLIGLTYTSSPMEHALRRVTAYVNSLFFVAVFATIVTEQKWRERVFGAFLAGMGLSLFLSLLSAAGFFPWIEGRSGWSYHTFYSSITHNLFMALAVYIGFVYWIHRSKEWSGWVRYATLTILALGVLDIFLLVIGRTGYLVFFAMVMSFAITRYRVKGAILGAVVVSLLVGIALSVPGAFRDRTLLAFSELGTSIEQGDQETPTGLRYRFYKYGLQIIAAKPLLGHGTGSVDYEYPKYDLAYSNTVGAHLHSEYLMVASELGIVGLLVFVALFVVMLRKSGVLSPEQRDMAVGVIAAYATGSLVNSLLLDANEGHLFALLTGVLFSGVHFLPGEGSVNGKY